MDSFAQIRLSMFPQPINQPTEGKSAQPILLIIDDNVDINNALTNVLQSRYRLITCLNYEEAKRSLIPEIKVVLLDIKMAGKDGIAVYQLLKRERPDLRIVFHSAYPGSSEKAAEIEHLRPSGYLTKGEYQTPELFSVIDAALNQ